MIAAVNVRVLPVLLESQSTSTCAQPHVYCVSRLLLISILLSNVLHEYKT
jgi:hypothetical protein